MPLFVDTSVWSLAFRRDAPPDVPEVNALRAALVSGDEVVTTGMILLELLRGALPDSGRTAISAAFDALVFIEPDRSDYEGAAAVATACRAKGVQLGSVDALLAQLAIRHSLVLVTTDSDFSHAARHIPLQLWKGK